MLYIHATGVETSLCPAPSCCRAKPSSEHTGSGSVCARQCKAAPSAPCPYQKSPPRWQDWCWDVLSVVPSISRFAGSGVLGHCHLCSSRHPLGFLLEAKDLPHLLMLSWTCDCSSVEPGSSFGYKHMYSDPVSLISTSSLNSYLLTHILQVKGTYPPEPILLTSLHCRGHEENIYHLFSA